VSKLLMQEPVDVGCSPLWLCACYFASGARCTARQGPQYSIFFMVHDIVVEAIMPALLSALQACPLLAASASLASLRGATSSPWARNWRWLAWACAAT
jgi:hypothetical protein